MIFVSVDFCCFMSVVLVVLLGWLFSVNLRKQQNISGKRDKDFGGVSPRFH